MHGEPHVYKQQKQRGPACVCVVQGDIEGRLLSYSPTTGQTQVLADNIWQANGVALSHDESFIVVASTASMRLYRYWLKGSKVPSLGFPLYGFCMLACLPGVRCEYRKFVQFSTTTAIPFLDHSHVTTGSGTK